MTTVWRAVQWNLSDQDGSELITVTEHVGRPMTALPRSLYWQVQVIGTPDWKKSFDDLSKACLFAEELALKVLLHQEKTSLANEVRASINEAIYGY